MEFGLSGRKRGRSNRDEAGGSPGSDGMGLSMEELIGSPGYQARSSRAFILIITLCTREAIPAITILCLGLF